MSDLMRYAAELEQSTARGLPPVEKWNPDYCGELDLTIKRDGLWIHEGTPIGRARLVRLFSTILRKDEDDYYLVTPVEKLKITVEDAPFTAVLMRRVSESETPRLIFTTNVGDEIIAGPDHAIEMRLNDETGEEAPYIHVRRGLDALIVRAVFYDLVAFGQTHAVNGTNMFGVWSSDAFFPFGRAADILEG